MHLKNIQINVDWCLKIMLILFILHKDKNVVTFWKKKSTIFYDIKIINALIYALIDISLARMETVCFIQPRQNMKTHSLILWWTLLKGQQLCFITILVQVNLSDTIIHVPEFRNWLPYNRYDADVAQSKQYGDSSFSCLKEKCWDFRAKKSWKFTY